MVKENLIFLGYLSTYHVICLDYFRIYFLFVKIDATKKTNFESD